MTLSCCVLLSGFLLIQAISGRVLAPQQLLSHDFVQDIASDGYQIPTVSESAQLARQILRNESIATLSTVFPSTSSVRAPDARHGDAGGEDELQAWENRPKGLDGMAIGLMDYYADCEVSSGNPTILALSIATSFKNSAAGSNMSMSVRQRPADHSEYFSPAAHARFTLLGHIEQIHASEVEAQAIESCFIKTHPDARAWLPGNKIHESWWARLVVEEIYWIGGFGDRAYIGWIPVETWRNASLIHA